MSYFFQKSMSAILTLVSTTPLVLTSLAISCAPVNLVTLGNSVILILMTVRINHVSTMAHVRIWSTTTPAPAHTATGASTAKMILTSVFHRRVLTTPRAKISPEVISVSVSLGTQDACVIQTLMNACYLHVRTELLAETK